MNGEYGLERESEECPKCMALKDDAGGLLVPIGLESIRQSTLYSVLRAEDFH